LQSAGVRAVDAYASIRRHAKRITEELNEITSVQGIPVTELSDEDSLVTTIAATIATTIAAVGHETDEHNNGSE
jgi:exonuclease VII large subunit